MKDILREYESFECLSLDMLKTTSEMDDLLDMYDNLTVLQQVSNRYSSESAQDFIVKKFSLEEAEDPTTGGNVTKKDVNNDGKNNAAAGSGIWKRLGGLKDRISGLFQDMRRKCIKFWDSAVSYASKLAIALAQKVTDLTKSDNNLNYQVNGICEDINNVQLTPIFAQLSGAKSKDEIGRIFGDLNSNLANKLIKEPKAYSKEDFVRLLGSYAAANKRIASERKTASNIFETVAKQTEQAKDNKEMTLREQQANASMSVSNTVIGYIFKNSVKLLGIAAKGMKKNG